MENKSSEEILENAKKWVTVPIPLTPYWDGQILEDFNEIPLDEDYTAQQWDTIFETFISHLNNEDEDIRYSVLNRLLSAMRAEGWALEEGQDAQEQKRLVQVCDAVTTHIAERPELFDEFCREFYSLAEQSKHRIVLLSWLKQQKAGAKNLSPELLAAAHILFGGYGTTWRAAGDKLIKSLDHNDLLVRACAAYQIGVLFNRSYRKGLPPLRDILDLMLRKEIERPGVAGAFWHEVANSIRDDETEISAEDGDEWLLDVLEKSPFPEPYIPLFPCNLAFIAHESFSADAKAIRRLINMGRSELAIEAATDEDRRIDDLEPLLLKLGNAREPETTRRASWHLAYHYNVLHPRGATLGFVEKIELNDIDLYLLFSERRRRTPYAAIIYGKSQQLTKAQAQNWAETIFPPSVRGEAQEDLYSDHQWYQRGYVAHNEENVIIGYRSDKPWNPKKYL